MLDVCLDIPTLSPHTTTTATTTTTTSTSTSTKVGHFLSCHVFFPIEFFQRSRSVVSRKLRSPFDQGPPARWFQDGAEWEVPSINECMYVMVWHYLKNTCIILVVSWYIKFIYFILFYYIWLDDWGYQRLGMAWFHDISNIHIHYITYIYL